MNFGAKISILSEKDLMFAISLVFKGRKNQD